MSAFGEMVRRRRLELGLTQHEVTARGGPSHQTLRRIETSAVLPPIRDFTASRLDRALDWVPGSAKAAIGNGTPPRPFNGPSPDQAPSPSKLQSRLDYERYGNAGRNFSIRLPDGLSRAVADRASSEGTTAAAVIRAAVAAFLDVDTSPPTEHQG